MSQYALRRLVTGVLSARRSVNRRVLSRADSSVRLGQRCWCDVKGRDQSQGFDVSVLQFLVCPLSKKPLRYDEKSNELINEELGIAYPIIDGIPNMIPQDARLIQKNGATEESAKS